MVTVGDRAPPREPPRPVEAHEVVEVPTPVVQTVRHEHLEVAAAVGVLAVVEVDLERRGEVPEVRRCPGRCRVDDTPLHPAEHLRDRGASDVLGRGELQHTVGREERDHLVEAAGIRVRVVPGYEVAHRFAGNQLVEIHRGRRTGQPFGAVVAGVVVGVGAVGPMNGGSCARNGMAQRNSVITPSAKKAGSVLLT